MYNKDKRHSAVFITMALTMLLPSPGRLACAIVLAVEMNILILVSTVLRNLAIWQMLNDCKTLLILTVLVTVTTIYSRLIAAWSPETEMQLGFVMYLITASSFVISTAFGEGGEKWARMKQSASFSAVVIAVDALRDVLCYGTITYPLPGGVAESVILADGVRSFTFFATIPGALLLIAAILTAITTAEKHSVILSRAQDAQEYAEETNA